MVTMAKPRPKATQHSVALTTQELKPALTRRHQELTLAPCTPKRQALPTNSDQLQSTSTKEQRELQWEILSRTKTTLHYQESQALKRRGQLISLQEMTLLKRLDTLELALLQNMHLGTLSPRENMSLRPLLQSPSMSLIAHSRLLQLLLHDKVQEEAEVSEERKSQLISGLKRLRVQRDLQQRMILANHWTKKNNWKLNKPDNKSFNDRRINKLY